MPVHVDIPGVGVVEFPDSMSADEVNVASKRLHDERAREPKMSAALTGTAMPDAAIGESAYSREVMNTPLARPTGIDFIDSFTSPTSILGLIGPSAARAAGRVVGAIPRPTGGQIARAGLETAKAVLHPKALADRGIAALEQRMNPAVPPPVAVGRLAGKAPTLDSAIENALNEMRQPAPAAAGPARLQEYPQAATDTMRALQNRPAAPPTTAAAKAVPTASQAPVAAYSHIGPDDLPRFKVAGGSDVTAAKAGELGYTVGEVPVEAGRASSTAARDAALARQAERVAAKPVPVNPNTALKTARDTFAALGETPRPAEVTNTMELILRGKTPEEAVAIVLKNRPATSPAEELARRLGTPNEAARIAAQDLRYTTGQVKSPSAETARGMKGR